MSKKESTSEEKLAFKDFKQSITVNEFETVYRICEEKYKKLDRMISQRNGYVTTMEEKLSNSKDKAEDLPEDKKKAVLAGMDKLLYSLKKRGDKDMFDGLSKDINELKYLIEFLNRFKAPKDYYSELDFSFLKDIKLQ